MEGVKMTDHAKSRLKEFLKWMCDNRNRPDMVDIVHGGWVDSYNHATNMSLITSIGGARKYYGLTVKGYKYLTGYMGTEVSK